MKTLEEMKGCLFVGMIGLMSSAIVGCANHDDAQQASEKPGNPAANTPAPAASQAQAPATAAAAAPVPLLKAAASPATSAALGISEWRVYRGRTDVILTGYDAKGSAVKGVSVGFTTLDRSSVLRTRAMDGSLFAARFQYGNNELVANGTMSARTSGFLKQTLSDFSQLQAATAPAAGTTRARDLVTTPVVAPTASLCGSHMMSILTSALQCTQSASATGITNSPQAQQCMLAAQNAASVGTTCTDSISTVGTWDITAGGTDCYNMAGGFDPGFGGSSGWGGVGFGGGFGGGWGGDGFGGDWGGGGWASSWGGDWSTAPSGGWGANPFGDSACPSCGGMGGMVGIGGMGGMGDMGGMGGMGFGGGDICGDSGTGGIGFGDGGGGWGAGY